MTICCSTCNTCCPEPADITVNQLNIGDDAVITTEEFTGETGLTLDLAQEHYTGYQIQVSRNGIVQAPSDYTTAVVGGVTRITFDVALQASETILVTYAYES